jgi:hypothetical protein
MRQVACKKEIIVNILTFEREELRILNFLMNGVSNVLEE